mgnify:CR=1 FL=1
MKGKDVVESFWNGSKDMLSVAIIIGIARAIPGVLSTSGIDQFFAQSIGGGLEGIGTYGWSYVMFITFGAFSFLIPSTSGLAGATMPVFAQTAETIFGANPETLVNVLIITVLMYSIAVGIVNMFIPTQAVVLASAERARVPYGQMLKPVGIYMGIITLTTLVFIIPITNVILF